MPHFGRPVSCLTNRRMDHVNYNLSEVFFGGVEHLKTRSYKARSIFLLERFHSFLVGSLRRLCITGGDSLVEKIPKVLSAFLKPLK